MREPKFTPQEVCFLLGCSRSRLRSWLKTNRFSEPRRGHHGKTVQREFTLPELKKIAGYYASVSWKLIKRLRLDERSQAYKGRVFEYRWLLFLSGSDEQLQLMARSCGQKTFSKRHVQALNLLALKAERSHKLRARLWDVLARHEAKQVR